MEGALWAFSDRLPGEAGLVHTLSDWPMDRVQSCTSKLLIPALCSTQNNRNVQIEIAQALKINGLGEGRQDGGRWSSHCKNQCILGACLSCLPKTDGEEANSHET